MNELDVVKQLWEEIKLRQEHYWSSFNRFALAILTLIAIPYVKPDLSERLGRAVLVFPLVALVLAVVCTWYLAAEYQRLRMVRQAYDSLFGPYSKIPRMPRSSRWERLVAHRVGSATSIIFGFGFGILSLGSLAVLLSQLPRYRVPGQARLVVRPASDARAPTSQPPSPQVAHSRSLTAVLFPYIPNAANDSFKALIAELTRRFEKQFPAVQLHVTIDPSLDVYDRSTLQQLLGAGPGAANIVELDTLFFGDLVSAGLIQPLSLRDADVLPTAWRAATVNDRRLWHADLSLQQRHILLLPRDHKHRECHIAGHVSQGLESEPHSSRRQLPRVLDASQYLCGRLGRHGRRCAPGSSLQAAAGSDDNGRFFLGGTELCWEDGVNPCLDGTYTKGAGTSAEMAFAAGKAPNMRRFRSSTTTSTSRTPPCPPRST